MNNLKMKQSDVGKLQKIPDDIPANEITSAFNFSMEVAKINTGRVKTAEELQDRFNQLFQLAAQMGKIPRYEHLILVSGLPRSTFYDYGNENYNGGASPIFSDIIKYAKAMIASAESELALTGKIPSVVYIFRSKNYEGLKDVQEVKTTNTFNNAPENPEGFVQSLPEVNPENFVEIKGE